MNKPPIAAFRVVGALVAVAAIAVPAALGAPGGISARGCIDDAAGADDCAREAQGLTGSGSIVVSPDGKSVYVAGFEDDSLVHLKRNRRTGVVRAGECISDPTGPEDCPRSLDGLDGAVDLAMTGDGKHLYVASFNDSAILHFRPNARTGRLRLADCVDDAGLAVSDNVCEPSTDGLSAPASVALSPDDRSLYVATSLDDSVVEFRINRTGRPVARGCFEDDDSTITDDCEDDPEGLASLSDVAVSPNGRSVYVAAFDDDAITRFSRDRPSGALSWRGCVEDNDPPSGPDDCAQSAEGLESASSIEISADGRFLYAGATNSGVIGIYKLTRPGAIRPHGCVESPGNSETCATVANGFGQSREMLIDETGRSMYVTGGITIQPFERRPRSGELIERPCIEDDDRAPSTTSCVREAEGLGGVNGLAMSPDERWLYTTSVLDEAVVTFRHR